MTESALMRGLPPGMMRMMLVLMDADGDGAISLAEFQAVQERLFKAIDINKDGRVTVEEIEQFIGRGRPALDKPAE